MMAVCQWYAGHQNVHSATRTCTGRSHAGSHRGTHHQQRGQDRLRAHQEAAHSK